MGTAMLPAIPLVDIGARGPLALLEMQHARAAALLAAGRRRHGAIALRLGDHVSREWLLRSGNPYRDEILAVAAAMGAPGAILLNLSFEWTCTTGAAADPEGGARLMRVLDWPMDGLGRHVVVARSEAPAGTYYNVTWPGSVGVLTAMAPGRFAAAINQAPMRRHGRTLVGDWATGRIGVWRSRHLPPAHLLRQVFETARTYAEAHRLLRDTPVALPALFTLAGTAPEDGCVIERSETAAAVHDLPVACANDALSPLLRGRPRGADNAARRALLAQAQVGAVDGFGWVRPPILNRRTRVAVVANAARGRLRVLGYEREHPATAEFALQG